MTHYATTYVNHSTAEHIEGAIKNAYPDSMLSISFKIKFDDETEMIVTYQKGQNDKENTIEGKAELFDTGKTEPKTFYNFETPSIFNRNITVKDFTTNEKYCGIIHICDIPDIVYARAE